MASKNCGIIFIFYGWPQFLTDRENICEFSFGNFLQKPAQEIWDFYVKKMLACEPNL